MTQQPINRLLQLKKGQRARIALIEGNKQDHRQLLSLGLRIGSTVNVLTHRGDSIVIQYAGTRMALGPGVVEKLLIEPISQTDSS